MSHYDIIIVGSGIVGATTALALSQNTALNIAVLEANATLPHWNSNDFDSRVSAISFTSKCIFQNLSLWESMAAKRISPYMHMHVWDEAGKGFIDFDAKDIHATELGFIIEDSVMRSSLIEKITETSTIDFIQPVELVSLEKHPDKIILKSDNQSFSAKLVIAADGANSWVRTQINGDMKTWDYEQTAIVATVQTELPHASTAWQRFLTTGPLAFLPLHDPSISSIVWSATHHEAQELLALNDEAFCERLSRAFSHKLGRVFKTTKRFHFPLRMRHVKNYVQDRIALIGDAAHTIHPLAGQGVNMGLMDAACLSDVILTNVEKKRDFSERVALRRYERWRKADNVTMLAAIDFIKKSLHQSE